MNLDSVVQVPPIGANGLMDYRWRTFLNTLAGSVPPAGSGLVTDGTATTYAPMTLFQGADAAKSGAPDTGDIYLALDTGRIYWATSGTWSLLSEELTGDVLKPANSNITELNTVFDNPGTYGSPTQTPVLSIDAKGRVIGMTLETVLAAPSPPAGDLGALQFNNDGVIGGASIFFNTITGGLTFSNPVPTREALSPLLVKGDIYGRSSTASVRQPVGTDGQVLVADSTSTTGLRWVDTGEVEVRFNFGDATPKPLVTIPANRVIKLISLVVLEPFDDPASELSITGLLLTTDNLPTVAGTYTVAPGVEYALNTPLALTIVPGTSTQGSGLITIIIE